MQQGGPTVARALILSEIFVSKFKPGTVEIILQLLPFTKSSVLGAGKAAECFSNLSSGWFHPGMFQTAV